jgi:hypothetical protein
MNKVDSIQVGGSLIFKNLTDACKYLVSDECTNKKMNFAIRMNNGSIGHITIRENFDNVVAYSDCQSAIELQDFVEYCMELKKQDD